MDSQTQDTPPELTYVDWLISLPQNSFLSRVDDEFIEDSFNLTGLKLYVPNIRECLKLLLGPPPTPSDGREYEAESRLLYGLIHARFIIQRTGVEKMLALYEARHWGCCPRFHCYGTSVLPMGLSTEPRVDTVKLFCPKCEDVYNPPTGSKTARLDGCFFGPSFPHLLILSKPSLAPAKDAVSYVPKIYGFRVVSQQGRGGLIGSPSSPKGGGAVGGGGSGSSGGGGGSGSGEGGGKKPARDPSTFTTHYSGERPEADDFHSDFEAPTQPSSQPQPPPSGKKRPRG